MHRLGYRLGCLAFDLGCLCLDFKSVIWEDYGNGVLSKFKDSPVVGVDDFRDAPASSLTDVQLQEDGRRLRKTVLHKDTASCQILNHAHIAKGAVHFSSSVKAEKEIFKSRLLILGILEICDFHSSDNIPLYL